MENSIILNNDFHLIIDGLLLGSLCGAEYIIKENKADHIISLLTKDDYDWPQFEGLFESCKIQRTHIEIEDAQDVDITVYLDDVADLIHKLLQDKKIVYLHCYAGKSRSPAFAIYYLMKYKHMSFIQAHDFVGSRRSVIYPNRRFIKDLKRMEVKLKMV